LTEDQESGLPQRDNGSNRHTQEQGENMTSLIRATKQKFKKEALIPSG